MMESRPCILPQIKDRGVCSARVYHVEVYCMVTGTSGASKKPEISHSQVHQNQRTEQKSDSHDLPGLVASHLAQ